MAQDKPIAGAEITRSFEQPASAVSFYSEFAQVLGTPNELVLQFYETIPGVPTLDGSVRDVKTQLRATVTVSRAHAANIQNALKLQLENTKVIGNPGRSS